jgi:hypothetical protein
VVALHPQGLSILTVSSLRPFLGAHADTLYLGELTGSVRHRRQPTSTVIVPFIVDVPVLVGAL